MKMRNMFSKYVKENVEENIRFFLYVYSQFLHKLVSYNAKITGP